MKHARALKSMFWIGGLLSLLSCAQDPDFDLQENTARLPVAEIPLLALQLDAQSLRDQATLTTQPGIVTDTLALDGGGFGSESVPMEAATLRFRFLNALASDCEVAFDFLNAANEVQYSVHVPVSAGYPEEPTLVETIAFIEAPEIVGFRTVSKFAYRITAQPDKESAVPASQGSIILQAKATFFFDD